MTAPSPDLAPGRIEVAEDRFDVWAIVEMLGHKILAGRVTEHVVAGQAFIRVDVPETPQEAAFSKLLGPGSIYAISPCSQELARAAAASLHAEPIPVYIPKALPAGPQLATEAELEEDDDEDERGYP